MRVGAPQHLWWCSPLGGLCDYMGKSHVRARAILFNRPFISYKPLEHILKSNFRRDIQTLQGRCPHPLVSRWINMKDGRDASDNIKICLVCGKTVDFWDRKEVFDPIALNSLFR